MQPKPALVAGCVLWGLMGFSTRPASALSCALPGFYAPRADATEVPTNTLVWCSSKPADRAPVIRLEDADGVLVRGTQTLVSLPEFELLVFRPGSELVADSVYQVDCPGPFEPARSEFSFRTGAGERSLPPAPPNLLELQYLAERNDWGSSYFARFTQVSEPDAIVVLDLAGNVGLDASEPSGAVADARFLRPEVNEFWVGSGACGGNWQNAKLGASTTVALGAFDLTGAFSGWTEPVAITLPDHFTNDSGCQLTTLGRASWGSASSLAALACVLLRRRARTNAR